MLFDGYDSGLIETSQQVIIVSPQISKHGTTGENPIGDLGDFHTPHSGLVDLTVVGSGKGLEEISH